MKKALAAVVLAAVASWFFYRSSQTKSPMDKLEPDVVSSSIQPIDEPIAKPTTSATAVALPTREPEEFQSKLEKTQAALPTLVQMRKLKPSEIHRTPKAILEAGADIGRVAEAIEKDPSLAPSGVDFYEKCARRADLSTSIRALCLGNLRELSRQMGNASNEEGISLAIRQLADKLND